MRRVNVPPRVILVVEKTVEGKRQNKYTVRDGRKAAIHVQNCLGIFSLSPFRYNREEAINKGKEDESGELKLTLVSYSVKGVSCSFFRKHVNFGALLPLDDVSYVDKSFGNKSRSV